MSVRPKGFVGTRIVGFKVYPTVVTVGEPVTIIGKLQYHVTPFCWWWDLTGEVHLLVDEREVQSQTAEGFKFVWTPREYGNYVIKVAYYGDLVYAPCESPEVVVRVLPPEERDRERRREFLAKVLWYGTLTLMATGAAVTVIYVAKKIK
ncbi:MAG: hypothetical protein DRN06_06720 [Thermoprotei archaeon]|nr:MAG: hypothetical protein DRN06_06720 [Thermoprotei archaeon]